MVILRMVMTILERVKPRTTVMALPMMGRKAKNPIHEPRPAMNRWARSSDFHVSQKSLDRAQRFMAGRGSWMGFFAFLPIIGSAITVVLGLTRANIVITILSMTIGKAIRYALIIWGTGIFT